MTASCPGSCEVWPVRDLLLLACAVQRDSDWESVSRTLHQLSDSPPLTLGQRFARQSCARQYDSLLRRHGSADALVTSLRDQRIRQLRRGIESVRARYQRLSRQLGQLREGLLDDRLDELLASADADDAEEDGQEGGGGDEPELKRRKLATGEGRDNSADPGDSIRLTESQTVPGFVSIKLSDIKREQCSEGAADLSEAVVSGRAEDVKETAPQSSAPSDTTSTASAADKSLQSTRTPASLSGSKASHSPAHETSSNIPGSSRTEASTVSVSLTASTTDSTLTSVLSSVSSASTSTTTSIASSISETTSTSSNKKDSTSSSTTHQPSVCPPVTDSNSEEISKNIETVVTESDEGETAVSAPAAVVSIGNASPSPDTETRQDAVQSDFVQISSPQSDHPQEPPSSEVLPATDEPAVKVLSCDETEAVVIDGLDAESPATQADNAELAASEDFADNSDSQSVGHSVDLECQAGERRTELESSPRQRRRAERVAFVRDSDSESVCTDAAASPASTADAAEAGEQRVWRRAALLVWREIAALRPAGLFLRPIGDDLAPGYSEAVRRPMDLQSLRRGVDAGTISSPALFRRDLLLMLANAAMFNSRRHHVHEQTRLMWRECVSKLRTVWPQLEAAGTALAPRRETREDHKRRRSVDLEVARPSSSRKRRL